MPNAIIDIYNTVNDSLSVKVATKTPEDYGVLNVNIESSLKSSFIIELINSKNVVVRVAKISELKTIKFESLEPGNYYIRVTTDKNNNGVWDTGNFLEKRQPEKIKFFDKEIELRANWDINETFIIE